MDAAPGGGTAFLFSGSFGDACLIVPSNDHVVCESLRRNLIVYTVLLRIESGAIVSIAFLHRILCV